MADTCHVRGCGRELVDAFVCQCCADQLAADLRDIIRGAHQVDVVVVEVADERFAVMPTATRRVQVGRRQGRPVEAVEIQPGDYARHNSTPYDHRGLVDDLDATFTHNMHTSSGLWDERAGRLRVELARTLVKFARFVATTRAISLPDDAQPLTVAVWLERHVDWLRGQEAGADAVTEIGHIVQRVTRAIDRPADLWYAGPCTAEPDDEPGGYCGEDLYAKPDAKIVRCRRCGQGYPLTERRDWLKTAADDCLAHAEWIGRAANVFGVDITPSAVRGYAHRGRIAEKGRDSAGRPLYRVGDVIAVAQAVIAERDRKAAASTRRKAG